MCSSIKSRHPSLKTLQTYKNTLKHIIKDYHDAGLFQHDQRVLDIINAILSESNSKTKAEEDATNENRLRVEIEAPKKDATDLKIIYSKIKALNEMTAHLKKNKDKMIDFEDRSYDDYLKSRYSYYPDFSFVTSIFSAIYHAIFGVATATAQAAATFVTGSSPLETALQNKLNENLSPEQKEFYQLLNVANAVKKGLESGHWYLVCKTMDGIIPEKPASTISRLSSMFGSKSSSVLNDTIPSFSDRVIFPIQADKTPYQLIRSLYLVIQQIKKTALSGDDRKALDEIESMASHIEMPLNAGSALENVVGNKATLEKLDQEIGKLSQKKREIQYGKKTISQIVEQLKNSSCTQKQLEQNRETKKYLELYINDRWDNGNNSFKLSSAQMKPVK